MMTQFWPRLIVGGTRLFHLARWGLLALATAAVSADDSRPELRLATNSPGRPSPIHLRLDSSLHPGSVLTLEATTNLSSWRDLATVHDGLFTYPDWEAMDRAHAFYRLRSVAMGPNDDWKNQAWFPDEPFRSASAGETVRWVKFAILRDEPWRVYFQDSTKYPFHYDFATRRLPAFLGWDRARFDAVSLHRTNQQVVLGAILYPPRATFLEYGIQFVGLEPYPREEVATWFDLVQSIVHASNTAGAVYMPTYEQTDTARNNADFFAARGITVASVERWVAGNHVYAPGWALGRLKFFPATEIDAAFADGRLRPEDILLTDGVPAETPLVAGIISLRPSTPNSHTAILAQSFGIPFVHLPDIADQTRVLELAGHKVVLRATVVFGSGLVKVVDADGSLTPASEEEMLALKRPVPIQFTPRQTFGAFSASTENLTPADIRFFGGKAANFGLLRRTVPTNSPPAIALSFDLWNAFLDQELAGSGTLRSTIASRLASFTNYPPDMIRLKTALAEIRALIVGEAAFTPVQHAAITNALRVFDPYRKIRFRSSTNVEDSEHFTGAGLYDSYSGCLLDDLDGDTAGPSQCDPDETNERGVFRAIQRVYASFYNDNAFLERLRHGVNESQLAMGVLVHHSFPDEDELANGVTTLDCRYSGFNSWQGRMVTQRGAESVTNPDGTAVPEIVDFYHSVTIIGLDLSHYSSRMPLGATVMNWESDYRGLIGLFRKVSDGYRQLYPARNRFNLDFEFKKDVNLGLVVKQVREIPNPATTNQLVPFLIDEPLTWAVAQREAGDVFGNHRLKSLWALHAFNGRLSASNLAGGLYTSGTVDYVVNGSVQTVSGPFQSWPGASNAPSGGIHSWTTGSGLTRRAWALHTALVTNVTGTQPPVFTQNDFETYVSVTYASPQPALSQFDGKPVTTTNEIVFLEPRRVSTATDILVRRQVTGPKGLDMEISFYWPNEPPTAAGYTAPLVRFAQTRITGLTSQPIVLTGYYSQTYRPGHHNFTEEFIFEPRLEPDLPASMLAELQTANILWLHVELGFVQPIVHALGFDQRWRTL